MNAITDFFENLQRDFQQNRSRKLTGAIVYGIFSLALGTIVALARHDVSRGASMLTLGIAGVFCGVTEMFLERSALRWATRVVTLGMWVTAMWLAFQSFR